MFSERLHYIIHLLIEHKHCCRSWIGHEPRRVLDVDSHQQGKPGTLEDNKPICIT